MRESLVNEFPDGTDDLIGHWHGNAQDKKKISIKYLRASLFDEIVMSLRGLNSAMPLNSTRQGQNSEPNLSVCNGNHSNC
jgi:hypothetical protein